MEPTRSPKLAPYLAVHDARRLARFIVDGLGGTISFEETAHDGTLQHLEVRVADAVVMVGETPPERPPFPSMMHLYVADADAAYQRALKAGATPVRPPVTAPDGDHRGGVRDAWGNEWWFTTFPRRT